MASPLLSYLGALDFSNSMHVLAMGLKERQLGSAVGAWFMGAQFPEKAGTSILKNLATLPRSEGAMAARISTVGAVGLLGLPMLAGKSDALGATAAVPAFAAGYHFSGALPFLRGGTPGATVGRGIAGMMAGSIAWQGLRGPRMSDYA
jgi:hypothetical protein